MIRRLLWLVLTAPLAVVTYFYLTDQWFYGEYLHATGDWSAKLLILALALTPLRKFLPNSPVLGWFVRQRRYFGLASFGYAAAHLLAYLAKAGALEPVASEAAEPGMLAGYVALLLFVPLALTSNDAAVKKLGSQWKRLHRLVYFAAILTFVHWALLAFDPVEAYVHAGVLALIECLRLAKRRDPEQ